jgi:hypothetical protein
MTDPFKGISKITRKEYQRIFPKKEEKMVA